MRCDILIVGAGPGGAAAGGWLARAGADVLLIDKANFPRAKPCGDGLMPQAVAELEALGLGAVIQSQARPFTGVRSTGPTGTVTQYALQPGADGQRRCGYVIPRYHLDEALVRQAIAAGCRFLPNFTAVRGLRRRGQLVGVSGTGLNGETDLQAALVIVATGASRSLAQALGLAPAAPPGGLALRGYVEGLSGLDETLDIYLDRELLPGYAWAFPVDGQTVNIGVGLTLNGRPTAESSRLLRAAFERLCQAAPFRAGRRIAPPQGYPLRMDFPAVCTHAPGLLVIGEAAGLVNPLTGEGIAWALESGRLAAQVASEALSAGGPTQRRLAPYSDALRARHLSYFEGARELLARLDHPHVLETLIARAATDPRIGESLHLAVVAGRPAQSIPLIAQALASGGPPALAAALFTLNAYRALLERCRAFMLAQIAPDAPSPLVVQLAGRGKMLRALLVFLGCQAAGGDPERVLAGAAGIELVHTASLIHDDIMDDAGLRRDLPALHRTLGVSRAIVCGDYLIAKSFRLLAESRSQNPAPHVVNAFIFGAEGGVLSCLGQYHDVSDWTQAALTEADYEGTVLGKTAAVIAGALQAGAALAGGQETLLQDLAAYGVKAGSAFQLRDDALEMSALADGPCQVDRRVSLPLIHAYQQGSLPARQVVERFLDHQAVTGQEVAALMQATDAVNYTNHRARALAQEAEAIAARIPRISEALRAFVQYAIQRGS